VDEAKGVMVSDLHIKTSTPIPEVQVEEGKPLCCSVCDDYGWGKIISVGDKSFTMCCCESHLRLNHKTPVLSFEDWPCEGCGTRAGLDRTLYHPAAVLCRSCLDLLSPVEIAPQDIRLAIRMRRCLLAEGDEWTEWQKAREKRDLQAVLEERWVCRSCFNDLLGKVMRGVYGMTEEQIAIHLSGAPA
jgi:hypothetical protein